MDAMAGILRTMFKATESSCREYVSQPGWHNGEDGCRIVRMESLQISSGEIKWASASVSSRIGDDTLCQRASLHEHKRPPIHGNANEQQSLSLQSRQLACGRRNVDIICLVISTSRPLLKDRCIGRQRRNFSRIRQPGIFHQRLRPPTFMSIGVQTC